MDLGVVPVVQLGLVHDLEVGAVAHRELHVGHAHFQEAAGPSDRRLIPAAHISVMASRLPLRRRRSIPGFLRDAMAIRRQLALRPRDDRVRA